MNKSLSILVFLLLVQTVFSQEVYVSSGKNYTTYSTKSENPLINSSNKVFNPGNSYEIGITFNRSSPIIAYSTGLTFNEYNTSYAISGAAIRYDWQTQYVGIQNSVSFDLLQSGSRANALQLNARLGLNSSFFVSGYQNANGINYNLTDNNEFKKIILQPFVGLQLGYPISDYCNFKLGYHVSIAAIGKDAGASFNYINQNVQAGISFNIN
jgi:hypothetical protein